MFLPTQTMGNTTEVEYISIYDKPKRGRGRPKTCKLSDEEKRQRKIEINRKILPRQLRVLPFTPTTV